MARRKSSLPELQPARLSTEQVKAALPKLERRLRECEAVSLDTMGEGFELELDDLQRRIDATLADVFGPDTLDYDRYKILHISCRVPMSCLDGTSRYLVARGYFEGVQDAAGKLHSAISTLEEHLEDMGEVPGWRALQAFERLDLHVEIERAAGALYRDGHYAHATVGAVKALLGLVRLRSGISELDWEPLMERAFSPKSPVLAFNELSNESDQNAQRGMMMLFSGAVTGLRSPRASEFFEDDPEHALEFIAFISLLAKLLDTATKTGRS